MKVDIKSKTAIIIMAVLGLMFVTTLITGYASIAKGAYKAFAQSKRGIEFFDNVIAGTEKGWNEGMFLRSQMVDAYGFISKLLGQNIVYDADDNKTVMRGSDGKLYYKGNVTGGDDENVMRGNLSKLNDFNEYCKQNNTSFLFAIAPDKYCSPQVELPLPVKDYMNTTLWFTRECDSLGVVCLNFQDLLYKKESHYSDGFFNTDHHWNIHTAFWAFQEIVGKVWPEDSIIVEEGQFITEIATTEYLGSMGVRAGRCYAGTDIVELIAPKYNTDLTVEYKSKTLKKDVKRSGPFKTSVIDNQNPGYNMYITSDNSLIRVVNHKNTNGRRVLLIKDSFGVPVAAWLSLMCEELWIVDVRYAQEKSVCSMVEENDVDAVIMLYNPCMLGSDMFRFREVSKGK